MLTVLFIVVFVSRIMVSIALHEMGHLIPAKRFGVRVSQYFVGFGSTLWSRQRGETTYGIKAFPLGGYVRLVGMVPPGDVVKPVTARGWRRELIEDARAASELEIGDERDRAFYRLAWWKKAIVMFGGPFVNLVIALVLFTVVFSGIGSYAQTLTVRDTVACVPAVGHRGVRGRATRYRPRWRRACRPETPSCRLTVSRWAPGPTWSTTCRSGRARTSRSRHARRGPGRSQPDAGRARERRGRRIRWHRDGRLHGGVLRG